MSGLTDPRLVVGPIASQPVAPQTVGLSSMSGLTDPNSVVGPVGSQPVGLQPVDPSFVIGLTDPKSVVGSAGPLGPQTVGPSSPNPLLDL